MGAILTFLILGLTGEGYDWFTDVQGEEVSIVLEELEFQQDTLSATAPTPTNPAHSIEHPIEIVVDPDAPDQRVINCMGNWMNSGQNEFCGPEALEESIGYVASNEEVVAYARDNLRLFIDAGSISMEPDSTQVLVNKPVYFQSDSRAQGVSTTLLGRSVQVRVSPQSFEWSFGDGTVFETTSAGGGWPEGDVSHEYSTIGPMQPSVTTRWIVEVSIDGGAWISVPGVGQTTAVSDAIELVEAQSVLRVPPR